ncbi:MAG: glycosyltransferase family 39 protein [Solirubrobacterales bacterium]
MVTRVAARNGGRLGLAALVAILLLGLGLRLGYAWDGRAPVYDAAAYAAIAANLEQGKGFTAGPRATQPSDNYSPGLPLLVAGAYRLSGGVHERLARLLLAVIGSLSVLFAYLIGRRLAGVPAGLIGAAAVAIYPAFLEYQGMLMSEPLAATLLSGSALAVLWARNQAPPPPLPRRAEDSEMDGPSPPPPGAAWRWLLPGALLGALALVRPEYLAVAFLLGLVVFASDARADWRRALASAAVLLAGVVVIVSPWTIRNAIALDRFVPISTGGGQVLFAGTYLPSDGNPERVGEALLERQPELVRRLGAELPPGTARGASPAAERRIVLAHFRLEQILAALAGQRYPGLETDRALSRLGREQLWDDITEEPIEYAGFLAAKIGRIWSHGPRDVMREPLWEALHWGLVAFGLIGLVVLARGRRWEALLLGAIFLAITALSALLVASPRRALVMLPLVAALAGVGASWTWSALREARRPEPSRRPQAG